MVNQQCGNCKKVINHVLEVCPHCKATKHSQEFSGMTYWKSECKNYDWPHPIGWDKVQNTQQIYGTYLGKVDMNAQERVAEAQRQLELAQEDMERESKTLSPEAQAVFDAFNGYKECTIMDDKFNESFMFEPNVKVNLNRNSTGCLDKYTELLVDYGLYVGNIRTDDNGNVILHFFKR